MIKDWNIDIASQVQDELDNFMFEVASEEILLEQEHKIFELLVEMDATPKNVSCEYIFYGGVILLGATVEGCLNKRPFKMTVCMKSRA